MKLNFRKTHCKNGHPYDPENTYEGKRGRSCKKCRSECSIRNYRKKMENEQDRKIHKEKKKIIARRWRLKNKYGISEQFYAKLFFEQGGACKICKRKSEFDDVLRVDHNHKTGLVRGLLCHNCNAGIGLFRESKDYLLSAISYLS